MTLGAIERYTRASDRPERARRLEGPQRNTLRQHIGYVCFSGKIPESGEPDRTLGNAAFRNDANGPRRDIAGRNGGPKVNSLATATGHAEPGWGRVRWTWKRAVCRAVILSDAAKLLAVTLCDSFAHHETGFCNPRVETIAEALGKSDRAVQRALSELRAAGWIGVQHGRGRGKTSRIAFLNGGDPAAFAGSERVTPMAACAGDQPSDPAETSPKKVTDAASVAPEKVTAASPIAAEKVTAMARKGDRSVTPYTEPKNNQKLREVANGGRDRPCPHLRAVAHFDSDAVADWNRWLTMRGFPSLEAMGILSSDAGGRGYDVLWRLPPSADDAMTTGFAVKWANWAAQEAEARHVR